MPYCYTSMGKLILLLLIMPWLLASVLADGYCTSLQCHNMIGGRQLFESVSYDTVVTTATRYRNGKVKSREMAYYDTPNSSAPPYKLVVEGFYKDGSPRYVYVMSSPYVVLYHAKYAPDNSIDFEKIYTYNNLGTLVQVETKRDGVSTFKTFDTDIFGEPIE